jgi:phosphatidylserine/phosphatidylglycerophosphate/cardiolipin synthase-like enzyme
MSKLMTALTFLVLTFASHGLFAQAQAAAQGKAQSNQENVQLLADQAFFPALMSALDKAEKEVDVLQFSFAIDRRGEVDTDSEPYKIAAKLAKLASQGKKVRVFIEANRDTASRNRLTGEWLSQRGVEVRYGATHAKGYRIDDKVITGSHNNTVQSFVTTTRLHFLYKIQL